MWLLETIVLIKYFGYENYKSSILKLIHNENQGLWVKIKWRMHFNFSSYMLPVLGFLTWLLVSQMVVTDLSMIGYDAKRCILFSSYCITRH